MPMKVFYSVIVLLSATLPGRAQCVRRADLNAYERGQFITVANGNRTEASAQFLSESGCGDQMLRELNGLGAKIAYADERVGYAMVIISREKLLGTLDIPGIEYAYTSDDERMYYQDPTARVLQSDRKVAPVPPISIPYPRVTTTVSHAGPYFATDEIGLTQLWKQYPDADGRGVRVAVPDDGFDLLHPALQKARDAQGNLVPKVADLETETSPEEDSRWVRFGEPIQTKNGNFEAAGATWTAPENGAYRFGIFKADLSLGPEDNSHSKKLSLAVGVLWDQQNNRVWVDTDGDGNFKNQRALGDYGTTHDVDWFGAKAGDDDNRIPFGLKIDAERDAVYVRIGDLHGALVAGSLASNKLTGGLFDGAAPGVQLIDENLDRGTALIAAMVKAAERPDTDVINRSGGIGRAGYTGVREGMEDFAQHVLERIATFYNKPIVCYCAAVGAIHVNDYAGPEMLRRNRHLEPPYRETINSTVSFVPNGLVNTVLAPSANLETESRYAPLDITWEDGKRRSFRDDLFSPPAPGGYAIGANNSPAIPVVSGVLADLISEAKRERVRYNSARLNNAIFTGARLLDGFPVSEQGYGLINAARSWQQLAKMANADDPKNAELTSFTVSRMEDGKVVQIQGFQADLANYGEKLSGEILITRHGGYAGGRKYTFSLLGNDGSIALLDHEATLERDKATRVRFRTSGTPGWHVVFLELHDTKADVVMQDVPLSVREPEVPEKIEPGIEKYESTIEPLRSEYRYVCVGDDVQAARYVMRIPYTGPSNVSTRSFPGGHYRAKTIPPGKPIDVRHHVGPIETLESLVVNDHPGTQDVFWENRGRPEYATQYDGLAPDVPIHAELTVSKYAVAINKSTSNAISVTNRLAYIRGQVELYDAALKTSELAGTGSHASAELDVTLPANLAQWRVRVMSDSLAAHPADVYLLNCSDDKGSCRVAGQREISTSGKTLLIDKPQVGNWRIVVRTRDQVSHPVAYTIREALLVLATAPIEAHEFNRASGATWTLPLPTKRRDAQYAAFRIAGTPGVQQEKDGLLIAMTPLDSNTP
jgi:hypothetical protein